MIAAWIPAVVIAAALATITPIGGARASAAGECADPGKNVPILLIHGLRSRPDDFNKHGSPTLEGRLGAISGVTVSYFDYHDDAARWVTNPRIGARLATRIACLGDASARNGGGGKIVVVAHSMGGLALRQAASQAVDGKPASDRLGLIVTVGTPNSGSWIEGILGGGPKALPATGTVGLIYRALGGACVGQVGAASAALSGVCAFLGSPGGEAALAMRPGSQQLAALPPPPADVPLAEVAGQVRVTSSLFGHEYVLTDDIGDLLVKPDSALAYTKRAGVTDHWFGCDLGVLQFVDVASRQGLGWEWQACTHGGLLYDNDSQSFIEKQVKDWIAASLDKEAVPTRGEICSEATLTHLEDLLWNRWFDSGAELQSRSPGYLLYAKDVLYPFTTTNGESAWSLKPGKVSINAYNPDNDYVAFSFEPDDFAGEFLGMGIIADSSGLIGSVQYHEGIATSGTIADRLRGPSITLDAWDGTSGRLGLECA